ncbi:MAG: DUF4159 domain-containing protein [Candidatus Zhuqueibacterota bacterium]
MKRKPLSVKFVQRAPRLVKPLELTKRPVLVQRTLSRNISSMRSITPRSMKTASIHGGTVLASLASPEMTVDRAMAMNSQPVELGPELIAGEVAVGKESSMKSLSDDLMNVRHLDTGRFKAMVVQDPNDKTKISGFFHMDLLRVNSHMVRDWDGNPGWNSEPTALPNVKNMVEKVTDIKMNLAEFIRMDSEKLMDSPMVVLTGETVFDYSAADAANLGQYLKNGGFLFFDDSGIPMIGSPIDRTARQLMVDALGPDIVFEKLPNDHRLYHCFFDFNGPPIGFDYRFSKELHEPYNFLEGVYIDGRLAILISNKAYCKFWDHAYIGEKSHGMGDPTRQLQFGVNIVVFALTQPGGIVQRQMNYK